MEETMGCCPIKVSISYNVGNKPSQFYSIFHTVLENSIVSVTIYTYNVRNKQCQCYKAFLTMKEMNNVNFTVYFIQYMTVLQCISYHVRNEHHSVSQYNHTM